MEPAANVPNRNPTMLTFPVVSVDQCGFPVKSPDCLESNTMLFDIVLVLSLVPFKFHTYKIDL